MMYDGEKLDTKIVFIEIKHQNMVAFVYYCTTLLLLQYITHITTYSLPRSYTEQYCRDMKIIS